MYDNVIIVSMTLGFVFLGYFVWQYLSKKP